MGERYKLPSPAGFGLEPRLQMNVGRTESPENASSDRKRRLLPVSLFDLAKPFDTTGGTQVSRSPR